MKEEEIRPQALFDALLAASREDIDLFFSDRDAYVEVECPGCGATRPTGGFEKLGFSYRECAECASLYLSPRPTAGQYGDYLRGSRMGQFFSEEFYRQTSDSRRAHIYRPRAQRVTAAVRRLLPEATSVADIGSGFGVFLTELQEQGAFSRLVGVEPDGQLAEICRQRGFAVLAEPAETATAAALPGGPADVATCFEVLEHIRDPLPFLTSIRRLLAPRGLLYLTTLTISGFDLQVLWERSKSIYPPHHINLLSLEGMERLLERSGYTVESIVTPGQLDLGIVRSALAADPSLPLPRFVHTLVRQPDEAQAAFQRFLQENRLSSHVHVVARVA